MTSSVLIPLVRPVHPLDPDDPRLSRHQRTVLVPGVGLPGLARLRAARVLVVGAGGLGSPVLAYLAAAGVGTLGIADGDTVDETNLQRQVIHGEDRLGRPKASSAKAAIARLNSEVTVEELPHVDTEWLEAHGREWDLIVECTDTFEAKYMVANWCARAGMPLVWGTVVGMSFQCAVFWSTPPEGLPATTLRDLHPRVPPEGASPSSLQAGVLGPVAGQAGALMATEALKLITGVGQPLIGRVHVADAARGRVDVIAFA